MDSALRKEKMKKMVVESYGDNYALPEDCIANVLSRTSPKDACRLSMVASIFRSAAQSDGVWERFLPSDYRDIISRSVDGPNSLLENFATKKDLYLHLCDHPILIDAGHKSFALEKWSGNKCYMLAARELVIVWSDTYPYWQWISHPESRFPEVAELLNVCWLEIRGKINTKMLSSGITYGAYLVFTTQSRMFGFEYHPADASVGISGHEKEKRVVNLDPDGAQRLFSHRLAHMQRHHRENPQRLFSHRLAHMQRHHRENLPTDGNTEYPKQREDGWKEVELGEYFVNEGGDDGDLEMSLMALKGYNGNWKGGLIIQGIEIRPKKCA